MSEPMTAQRFCQLARKHGIDIRAIHPEWIWNNRNSVGDWNPKGVMWHHTASESQTSIKNTLFYGRKGKDALAGPLCQVGIDMSGIAWLAGWGRANHAGPGCSNVLNKVISERYTGILKPKNTDADGNTHFYGFEFMYSGTHEMTDEAYRTGLKLSAMTCGEHDWTSKSTIAHGEWRKGNWDPGVRLEQMMDMNKVRVDIRKEMRI